MHTFLQEEQERGHARAESKELWKLLVSKEN